MSRVFKNKENQITQKYKSGVHNGIDLVGYNYALDYIVTHSDGEVVGIRADYKTTDKTGNSYGNYVKIKHGNGYYTLYAHLKYGSVTVKVGDKVTKGQTIGYMGNTGHSIGAHLHFEVRNTQDIKIDPANYIDGDLPNTTTTTEPVKPTVDILILVKETIRGDFGNGEARKKALGNNYAEVQKQVNLNFKHGTTNWDNIKLY